MKTLTLFRGFTEENEEALKALNEANIPVIEVFGETGDEPMLFPENQNAIAGSANIIRYAKNHAVSKKPLLSK